MKLYLQLLAEILLFPVILAFFAVIATAYIALVAFCHLYHVTDDTYHKWHLTDK